MIPLLVKQILGSTAVFLTLAGYLPYLLSIMRREIRPHMFSWIVWSIVNGIAFAGQLSRGGGAGAWTTGVTSAICLLIAVFSIVWGEKDITRSDWISFVAALLAIPLWAVTSAPLGAVILSTIIDLMGVYPTARKSFARPYDEKVFTWGLIGFRSGLSLIALEHYSMTTLLFPISTTLLNSGMALLLVVRRRQLGRTALGLRLTDLG